MTSSFQFSIIPKGKRAARVRIYSEPGALRKTRGPHKTCFVGWSTAGLSQKPTEGSAL